MINKAVKWYRHGKTPKQRFYGYIETVPETMCWEFMGTRNKKGYGVFTAENTKYPAHRFSWMIHKGDIPDGLYVLHKCDNPPCVNPEHLFLGTQFDNMQDMIQKGRGANVKGNKNPRANLSDEIVLTIRKFWDLKITPKDISKQLGVPITTVHNILSNATWSHLPSSNRPPSNRGSLLSENDVREMRRLYSFGLTSTLIGKMFRLTQQQAWKVVNRWSWKNVE